MNCLWELVLILPASCAPGWSTPGSSAFNGSCPASGTWAAWTYCRSWLAWRTSCGSCFWSCLSFGNTPVGNRCCRPPESAGILPDRTAWNSSVVCNCNWLTRDICFLPGGGTIGGPCRPGCGWLSGNISRWAPASSCILSDSSPVNSPAVRNCSCLSVSICSLMCRNTTCGSPSGCSGNSSSFTSGTGSCRWPSGSCITGCPCPA